MCDSKVKYSVHVKSAYQPSGLIRLELILVSIAQREVDGRCGGLMVSGLDSGMSSSGSNPGWEHCTVCVLGQDTSLSIGNSLQPVV